jgi:hypothetical protein
VATRESVDVLLVSPGTTAGWRRVDSDFASLLSELGVSVVTATSDYRIVRHLRRTVPLTDLAEAAAMRHALTPALRRHRPRAIVYSSTQAAMLQPRGRLAGAAVRFDALTTVNRAGAENAIQHRLERRALGRVALLLPSGLDPGLRVSPALRERVRTVALPLPIERSTRLPARRQPFALCYAGNPPKKGLDLIAQAWRIAAPAGRRLVVTGLEPEAGRAFLRSLDVTEPPGVEWAGAVAPSRFRELTASAEVFVAASRFEDYGLAQLEALADGALLVTTPSAGPYEALPLARELESELVAAEISAESLARPLRAAFSFPEEARRAYRERAWALVSPYSREELKRRVSEQVLPVLLPGRS